MRCNYQRCPKIITDFTAEISVECPSRFPHLVRTLVDMFKYDMHLNKCMHTMHTRMHTCRNAEGIAGSKGHVIMSEEH